MISLTNRIVICKQKIKINSAFENKIVDARFLFWPHSPAGEGPASVTDKPYSETAIVSLKCSVALALNFGHDWVNNVSGNWRMHKNTVNCHANLQRRLPCPLIFFTRWCEHVPLARLIINEVATCDRWTETLDGVFLRSQYPVVISLTNCFVISLACTFWTV